MGWSPIRVPKEGLTWDEITAVGEKIYGASKATDPRSGYEDKAVPAVWHGHRSVLKDSLTVDDTVFPRTASRTTEDHVARAGDMAGPTFEYHLFTSATGVEMSLEEFDLACERIFNLERAILVRDHGRSRQTDESIIPYLKREENWVNPLLGERQSLDREAFLRLMDEYYALRGWDRETGRPTQARLDALGLGEVADDLKGRGLLP
jgi:aldehyde:ferredoxin oxidoreductase